jgi:hypothetical protein
MALGVDQHGQAIPSRLRCPDSKVGPVDLTLPLQPVSQSAVGGIPVVAIGDEGLARTEVGFDRSHGRGFGQPPHPMRGPIDRGDRDDRLGVECCVHGRTRVAAASVRQENGLELGTGGGHEFRAVGDGSRKDFLVRQHDTLVGIMQ